MHNTASDMSRLLLYYQENVEIKPKNWFWEVFCLRSLMPYEQLPKLLSICLLMEVHNNGKFHEYSICGCEVINLHVFWQQQKVGFFADFLSQESWDLEDTNCLVRPFLGIGAFGAKVRFFLILKKIFKCGFFSRYHTQIFGKKKLFLLMQNLILNRLALISNYKNKKRFFFALFRFLTT